jgi:hypothetical protein
MQVNKGLHYYTDFSSASLNSFYEIDTLIYFTISHSLHGSWRVNLNGYLLWEFGKPVTCVSANMFGPCSPYHKAAWANPKTLVNAGNSVEHTRVHGPLATEGEFDENLDMYHKNEKLTYQQSNQRIG